MNLDHWIESLFPLTLDTDWDDFFAKPSNPFSAELLEKIKAFLEEIHPISGINNCLEEFLPILLSSGNPEAALSQLLDFSKSFL